MGSTWEIDFYSRPIVDENNKKLWEVLVCESPLTIDTDIDSLFRYAQYCPSTQVNSAWLKAALAEAIAQAGVAPLKFRFFRRQMNNMIVKACEDLGIPAQPSRRTITLNHWLQQRLQDVYPQEPGYRPISNPSVRLETSKPQRLPDALIGQKWTVVSTEAAALEEMPQWDISFGEAFPWQIAGIAPETQVPGIAIFSPRALPLAGWMSSLELAFLQFDNTPPGRLLLATGASDSWIVANLTKPETLKQVQEFETAKQKANGMHFLAVQSDPNSQSFAGFWLLQEIALP